MRPQADGFTNPRPLASELPKALVRRNSLSWLNSREEREPLDELSSTGLARCGRFSPLATAAHEDDEFSSELPAVTFDPVAKPAVVAAAATTGGAVATNVSATYDPYGRASRDLIGILAVSGWLVAAMAAVAVAVIYLCGS